MNLKDGGAYGFTWRAVEARMHAGVLHACRHAALYICNRRVDETTSHVTNIYIYIDIFIYLYIYVLYIVRRCVDGCLFINTSIY